MGDNVVHLEYLGELNEACLSEINEKLKTAGLELSSFNKSGVMYNSFEEYSLVTFFVLNQPLIIELLKGVGTNALWDVIKRLLLLLRTKIKGERLYLSSFRSSKNVTITHKAVSILLEKKSSLLWNKELNRCL